jgi:hypothetical protein
MFTEYLKRPGKQLLEGMKADGALYCGEIGLVWRRRKRTDIWWGNIEGNRPLEKPNCRWENNNNIDVMAWIRLIWLRTDTSSNLM